MLYCIYKWYSDRFKKKECKKECEKECEKEYKQLQEKEPPSKLQELAESRYNARQLNDFVNRKRRVYWANFDD